MGSGGSSYDSIISIHGIGKDWGRLPHREPLYVKRQRDRRREHEGFREDRQAREHVPEKKPHETDVINGDGEGFEVTV